MFFIGSFEANIKAVRKLKMKTVFDIRTHAKIISYMHIENLVAFVSFKATFSVLPSMNNVVWTALTFFAICLEVLRSASDALGRKDDPALRKRSLVA